MAAPRPFVVLLLVAAGILAIVFVLGVGRTFELPKPNVRSLSKGFGAKHLQLAELVRAESARACVTGSSGLQIPAGLTCSLTALASDEPVWRRRVVLVKSDGRVKVLVVSDGPPVNGKPHAGEETEFPIAREGARIDLTCLASTGQCNVTWLR